MGRRLYLRGMRLKSAARLAVARAGRNRSVLRRLPADLGGARYPASTEGGLKHLKRDVHAIDPELTRFALEHVRSGSVVWDVGANVGLFTFAAAGLAGTTGRVIAVEPDLWLALQLQRAARRSVEDRATVDVLAAAVSDSAGTAVLHVAQQSRAINHLRVGSSSQTGGIRYIQPVPKLPLDSLLEHMPPPDVIKIDVERAELQVLRGAQKVLAARPTLLVEVDRDHADEASHILLEAGYRLIDWQTGLATPVATWSTLAVPV